MVKSTIIVFIPYVKFSAKNTIMLTLLGNKHASKYHFCFPPKGEDLSTQIS